MPIEKPAAQHAHTYQEPAIVRLSDEERKTGHLTQENIAMAVLGFARDGLLILENAIDTAHLDALSEVMQKEADQLMHDPNATWNDATGAPLEKRCGNISQAPPMRPEFMFEDVWANKAALSVLESTMGPKPILNFVNGNTALAMGTSGRQSVHGDLAYNIPSYPYNVCINIYLDDASEKNGVTELWLGTAKDSCFEDHKAARPLAPGQDPYKPFVVDLSKAQAAGENAYDSHGVRSEPLEARRAWAPPVYPTVKKGSIMIRDMRTWHAGISNKSDKHRIMLAYIYTTSWLGANTKLYLPENVKPFIDEWAARKDSPCAFAAEYLPTEEEVKKKKFMVDFASTNPGYWKMVPGAGKLAPGVTFSR